MTAIKYQKDSDNIIHLILDKENASANLMDMAFTGDLAKISERLVADIQSGQQVIGVIIRSAKSSFFAGGDLNMLYQSGPGQAAGIFAMVESLKASMRKIESCGKPVVACIGGAAMGGGWELALACHHRIAVNHKKIKLGLPEVTLGLLPGAGGVTRMVRLLGLEKAMPYLLQGKFFDPAGGVELGLIHELVADEADAGAALIKRASEWIKKHRDLPETAGEPRSGINCQPWDIKGYNIPGGTAKDQQLAGLLPVTPAIIRRSTQGTLPAPERILATMVEGTQVDFASACRIESRYFTELATGKMSKNLINTFWYQLNEIKAGSNRPGDIATRKLSKVGILGAGMMGAGIAYSCAVKGISVVLKDVSLAQAKQGKDYSRKLLDRQVARGRMTPGKAEAVLALIQPSEDAGDLSGCEFVIEAVFEDRELKAKVTRECEQVLAADAVFASNTSTLPITGLAQASARPEHFIGMHFFSPVDKMALVEIICGEKTSDQALALCYDLTIQLGKTPIVVNDSRGFYTSRVFSTYVKEGIALLEDAHPASIENAAYLSGFPVGPLAVTDEVTLSLIEKIAVQTQKDLVSEGKQQQQHPADAILKTMLELGRTGKAGGAGFYDYLAVGKEADDKAGKKRLSPELTRFNPGHATIPLQDIKDRLLFIMALETARCVEEGVLRSTGDGNIGAVFGIGYPKWTGGTLQFINHYGLEPFITRAGELSRLYGERFNVPASLRDMLAGGQVFSL
ncbi:3-hydroxyacyl-CoA dehydrogenase NAD-binding domain-containing protein [Thalassomonas haliotis]|uniref:Enoyl-CoA hydratase/isomerase family protein n=1 Tax=Thalassomonas haliotis TaxID=485448 RepID=A0ABY7VK26_9GAMM|nr:3-hydroxyacyl-CoA dehydrogenase NAD-binding domain-containing protein [Thalassomonas haliotis]WDE13524.1 enoyl-CoA hydratase/isomerase family protein [Thalassomonas haliotis]